MKCEIQRVEEGLSCLRPRLSVKHEPGGVVEDRISQPADIVNEWETAIAHADELADTARLEIGWHEKKVARCIHALREGSFECGDEEGIRVVVNEATERTFPFPCCENQQRNIATQNMLKQGLAMVFLKKHLDLLVSSTRDHDDERAGDPF